MKKLTMQDVVDHEYRIRPKRGVCENESHTGCAYLDPETGNRCGFGEWIRDDVIGEVHELYEEVSARNLVAKYDYDFSLFLKPEVAHITDIDFWEALQEVHDDHHSYRGVWCGILSDYASKPDFLTEQP